ncbi:hypothetical protein IHE45_04G077500 [Dioscorea alata]|uniref:Uncharacterized protein n=1 Tax=Dioscorea alata TaxID=55571 RepID=A0ACB7WD93_DIOAL|nr:hypothetical protein IHE45_04G077500 [Dioscorea alata]
MEHVVARDSSGVIIVASPQRQKAQLSLELYIVCGKMGNVEDVSESNKVGKARSQGWGEDWSGSEAGEVKKVKEPHHHRLGDKIGSVNHKEDHDRVVGGVSKRA